jgi:hypothetical protein
VRLEGLGQLKTKIHLVGTRNRDLPPCSIVHQPTTLPMPLSRKDEIEINIRVSLQCTLFSLQPNNITRHELVFYQEEMAVYSLRNQQLIGRVRTKIMLVLISPNSITVCYDNYVCSLLNYVYAI